MNQPKNYSLHEPIISGALNQDITPYIHSTGFNAHRIITGIGPNQTIDPYRTFGNPARGCCSGQQLLYTTDKRESAFMETLGHTGDGPIPSGTYELQFEFTGNTLNLEKVGEDNPQFKKMYYRNDSCTEENHEFSQSLDHYLRKNGLTGNYQSKGWMSVQDTICSGYVHACNTNHRDALKHIDTIHIEMRS